jgi:MFS family permease
MGGVNSAPRYVQKVGIGNADGKITDTLHEGGIVSIYYLGCIFGCFAGGYLADRIGRINGSVASQYTPSTFTKQT